MLMHAYILATHSGVLSMSAVVSSRHTQTYKGTLDATLENDLMCTLVAFVYSFIIVNF